VQTMVNLIPCNLACLAIAALYYSWRDGYCRFLQDRQDRQTRLRDRVALMLWVMANRNGTYSTE
jgi:hypothetical protein